LALRKELPVRWSFKAADDLEDIYKKIESRSPQNAIHVITNLVKLANGLGFFPEKYPKLLPNETNRNLRSVSKWSYRIIYEVNTESVKILKIFDSSENPDKLLKRI
jgi:plasmid stabilization system protein ParE